MNLTTASVLGPAERSRGVRFYQPELQRTAFKRLRRGTEN